MDEPRADTTLVSWPSPPPTLRYSNLFVVEVRDTLVSLTFGQVSPVWGTSPGPQGVEARDVTRVVLSKPVAGQLLQVLAEHIGEEEPA